MRQNITLYEVEETQSRDGSKTYWKAKTNLGEYSVWDEDLAANLKEGQGMVCDVEVEIKGKYKNITALNGSYAINAAAKAEAEADFKKAQAAINKGSYSTWKGSQGPQPNKPSYQDYEDKKQKSIEMQSRMKLKSIAVAYALQKYNAEIPALIEKTKDLIEAEALIEKRSGDIAKKAAGFYELIRSLGKIAEVKPAPSKPKAADEPITAQEIFEEDYSDVEVVEI